MSTPGGAVGLANSRENLVVYDGLQGTAASLTLKSAGGKALSAAAASGPRASATKGPTAVVGTSKPSSLSLRAPSNLEATRHSRAPRASARLYATSTTKAFASR